MNAGVTERKGMIVAGEEVKISDGKMVESTEVVVGAPTCFNQIHVRLQIIYTKSKIQC